MVKDTIEHHIRQTDQLSLISEDFLSDPLVRIKKKMMGN
jgi:hypothetical protein